MMADVLCQNGSGCDRVTIMVAVAESTRVVETAAKCSEEAARRLSAKCAGVQSETGTASATR